MQERREQERMEREAHRVGQHWLEAAVERVRAGEPEEEVLADYGYVPDIPPDYEQG